MSQPIRYDCNGIDGMIDALNGDYVKWDDYAALVQQGIRDHADWRSKLNFLEADYKTEIARLTAENERLRSASFVTAVPSEQYERVTKAGDAFLGTYLFASVKGLVSQDIATKVIEEWQAAKEGGDAK